MRWGAKKPKGFTLVELIVVIVITGILSTFIAQFIIQPINAYSEVARRTRLVDVAGRVMHKIRMDVREALPNSLRTGCNRTVDGESFDTCMEFLRAPFGGRYRIDGTGSANELKISNSTGLPLPDNGFEMLVPFSADDRDAIVRNTNLAAVCADDDFYVHVVINNQGTPGADAWEMDNMARLGSLGVGLVAPALSTYPLVSYMDNDGSGNFTFPSVSVYQRFFLVDTPVKYVWDNAANKINRYSCYDIEGANVDDDDPDGEKNLLSAFVSRVKFDYQPGTSALPIGLLNISVTVSEDGSAESITLLQQIQIINMS